MRRFALVLCAVLAFVVAPTFAQRSVPEIPFESVPDFFKLPYDMNFGDTPAVAVDSKGNIFVATRANVSGPAYGQMGAQVLEFDKTGKFMREVGKNLYAWSFTHGIRVDKQDMVWVIDKGSDMVVKLNPETGHVVWVFGRRGEASDENGWKPRWSPRPDPFPKHDDSSFRMPTDVAWDSAGNTYVADGYVNSRVAVFDKNGDWVKSFGERGKGPGQFSTVHSIAIDAQDNIYVADRANSRIQVFDKNFKVLHEWKLNDISYPTGLHSWSGNTPTPGPHDYSETNVNTPGTPWCLCITPGPKPYLYVGDGFPGRIYKMTLDGKVLGTLGRVGRQLGQFGWVHGLACPSENELYAADENNFRVQKLILHPTADQR